MGKMKQKKPATKMFCGNKNNLLGDRGFPLPLPVPPNSLRVKQPHTENQIRSYRFEQGETTSDLQDFPKGPSTFMCFSPFRCCCAELQRHRGSFQVSASMERVRLGVLVGFHTSLWADTKPGRHLSPCDVGRRGSSDEAHEGKPWHCWSRKNSQ